MVAIHGFPGMWWSDAPNWDWCLHWRGWEAKVDSIRESARGRRIWVTETGLATCEVHSGRPERFALQKRALRDAASAPVERVYWYSLIDLDPARAAIEGFHVDENEYHMGLVDFEGRKKPAWYEMQRLLASDQDELFR